MKTLTGMGGLGNAQELAELLRQMGRGPDSMLAHITPEEAQMLLESGGSGTMNPMTGLPEFVPTADNDYRAEILASEPPGYYGTSQTGFNEAVDAAVNNLPMTERMQYDTDFGADPSFQYTGQQPESFFRALQYTPQYMSEDLFLREKNQSPAETLRLQEYAQGLRTPQEVQPSILDRLKGGLQSAETGYQDFTQNYPMLSRLLTTGAASLPSLLAARSARREGRAAADELRALGAPLRQEAENLRRQALTGGLTPQQARQEEARRASMRQAASTRGATTGTQQAMIENTLARERSGLAQTNLENAMRQLNLANTVSEAAIRARLASDRDVDRYLSNIYTNLIRTASGGQGNFQQPQGMTGQEILPERRLFEEPSARR
jgi:hypothetical protein